MNTDELDKCLRSELSAIETYQQALDKHRQHYGEEPNFQQLSQILHAHEQAAGRLRSVIQQHGGSPSNNSGAWGTWSKTIVGAAKLLGDKTALRALKEGEESGLKEYQAIVQDSRAATEAKTVASELATQQHAHIRQLEMLIQAA